MITFDKSDKDVLLATAIAAGATATAAAKQFDLAPITVYRRMEEPHFRNLVADLRAEMVSSALGEMADSLTFAARQIRELMSDANPSVRLRACRAMITLTLKLHQAEDVDRQLGELKSEFARLVEVSHENE